MWMKHHSLQEMQNGCVGTLVAHLGIEFLQIGAETLTARMPVDHRTCQPMGVLHGGASAAFAETLGGAGAYLSVDEQHYCVGLEINANHIRPVRSGWVTGVASPLHRGQSTQVWSIDIRNEFEQLVCVSRLTVAVLSR